MLRLGPSSRSLRTAQLVRPRVRLYASTKHDSRKSPFSRQEIEDDTMQDFRPPWVYRASGFLIYTMIPVAILYCVFVADYGDREHVFSPVRRWAQGHTESFLSLTPEETALAQRDTTTNDITSQKKAS
ncbi:hypothetical protein F5J12DRAFT_804134 [Pisolithus orientalis]|uniref:uncharacterized protein n=1 Tax=Pisolithus orientalis TaxID=936130 RepID=UPI002224BF16|nr:uncharacterized protein F5J12DRAFT_804134 [Pisolithus orientalis]KAI6030948.1 hypothetical protein F5J12DRAFT_804134 [Pisolithus orientalis]